MSRTLVTITPTGVPFIVATQYRASTNGGGRIVVKVRLNNRTVQQRTMPYDHNARDPHTAAIRAAFGRTGEQLSISEVDRPAQWPALTFPRTFAVKVSR